MKLKVSNFRRGEPVSNYRVRRGDVFYANLSPVVGTEQGGTKLVLVLQNNTGNRYSNSTIIAAITSQTSKKNIPTHVPVNITGDYSDSNTIVLLEQIRTIDKSRLRNKVGYIDKEQLQKINRALVCSLAIEFDDEKEEEEKYKSIQECAGISND